MTNSNWTVVRVRGGRGLPAIDGLEFLGCVAALRDVLGDTRWHFRWVADRRRTSRDGLRVELPFDSPAVDGLVRELEARVPPPDLVFGEPMRLETDLDPIQNDAETDDCLTLLWRYSEFLADLRLRNPQLSVKQFQSLSPGAFLTFVTGDRRHFERAMDEQSVTTVPVVSFGRVVALVRAAPMPYRVPPKVREEAVNAARIHHLAGCTFASHYYPFARTG